MPDVQVINSLPYFPVTFVHSVHTVDVPTAWRPNEEIINDILTRYSIDHRSMIDFGVDYGFSTSAFANYFSVVLGIDNYSVEMWNQARKTLKDFKNISLLRVDYKDWIKTVKDAYFDLIHIDIIHTFEDTYQCGRWAVDHASIVLFHDTISNPPVHEALMAISSETGIPYYNWPVACGLGILTKQDLHENQFGS
jgi:hypothetical protein